LAILLAENIEVVATVYLRSWNNAVEFHSLEAIAKLRANERG
jgi:hypothetical protein